MRRPLLKQNGNTRAAVPARVLPSPCGNSALVRIYSLWPGYSRWISSASLRWSRAASKHGTLNVAILSDITNSGTLTLSVNFAIQLPVPTTTHKMGATVYVGLSLQTSPSPKKLAYVSQVYSPSDCEHSEDSAPKAPSRYRFRYIAIIEIVAGVIPEIRDACPIDAGRCLRSLSTASRRSCLICS